MSGVFLSSPQGLLMPCWYQCIVLCDDSVAIVCSASYMCSTSHVLASTLAYFNLSLHFQNSHCCRKCYEWSHCPGRDVDNTERLQTPLHHEGYGKLLLEHLKSSYEPIRPMSLRMGPSSACLEMIQNSGIWVDVWATSLFSVCKEGLSCLRVAFWFGTFCMPDVASRHLLWFHHGDGYQETE